MSTIRQEAIKSLYLEAFPDVARYISRKGGSEEDAREIFQEAIVVYHETVVFGRIPINTSPRAYLFGICRNLWHNHFNASIKTTSVEDLDLQEEHTNEPTEKIARYLQMAGEKCMNLLQSFYYEKRSMSQLAKQFGFASERSATVQKYKCLEKVRDEVKSKSLTYEDFIA